MITVKVKNIGGGACTASPTVMEDPSQPGVTFLSVVRPSGWTCQVVSGTERCTMALAMAPLAEATFSIRAQITAPAGTTLTNCATATNPNDVNSANNQGCAPIRVVVETICDLRLEKTMAPTTLVSGATALITVTVKNVGTGNCVGTSTQPTVFTDGPVTGLTFNGQPTSSRTSWFCGFFDAATVGCSNPTTIGPGNTTVFTIRVTVTEPAPGPVENCATISNPNDKNPANDRDCVSAAVK
ncbi:MAG: DUF11 domain-containing protein [Actinobacteria bacterium]|nr:DUF11 domain-containing protein [Actinomycetota bacterium]